MLQVDFFVSKPYDIKARFFVVFVTGGLVSGTVVALVGFVAGSLGSLRYHKKRTETNGKAGGLFFCVDVTLLLYFLRCIFF